MIRSVEGLNFTNYTLKLINEQTKQKYLPNQTYSFKEVPLFSPEAKTGIWDTLFK